MEIINTLLMFDGQAEEAMNFYVALFPGSKILNLNRYTEDGNMHGKIMHATFNIHDQTYMCIDSPVKHAFGFTPAISIHVTTDSEREIDRIFDALNENGQILMPLSAYPFSKKFAWVTDRFGVSWQLNYSSV